MSRRKTSPRAETARPKAQKSEPSSSSSGRCLRVVPPSPEADAVDAVSEWVKRYGEKHRYKRISAPGLNDGRLGGVTIYERGPNILLHWFENGRNTTDTIKTSEYDDVLTEALLRAAEINRRLSNGRSPDGVDGSDGADPPLSACISCGGTRFWQLDGGPITCFTCHPPARPEVVTWIDVEGKTEAPDA